MIGTAHRTLRRSVSYSLNTFTGGIHSVHKPYRMTGLAYKLLVFILYKNGTNYPNARTIVVMDDGLVFINRSKLALRLKTDLNTLKHAMATLEELGFITIIPYPPKGKLLIRVEKPSLYDNLGGEKYDEGKEAEDIYV